MHAELSLPCAATSAAAARRFVSEQLRGWNGRDFDETATLLVSELVTNAVLHARSAVSLALSLDGPRLRVEVGDDSKRVPALRQHSLRSATGRGLRLVEQFADAWGVQAAGTGKTVWFELVAGAAEPEPDLEFFAGLDDDLSQFGGLSPVGRTECGCR